MMSPLPQGTPIGGLGEFEYFEQMLPPGYREELRRLQLFTLAQQLRKVSTRRSNLESELGEIEADAFSDHHSNW